jgi:hypothetical protein
VQPRVAPWAFVLSVPDVDRSSQYFPDVQGFHISWAGATDWHWPRGTAFGSCLANARTDMHPSALGSHNWFGYLDVDGLDGLHAEFTPRGAVCSALKNTHYGMREIVITTTDGRRLVCSQPSKRT